ANVELAKRVLRDAGSLKQHLVERLVVALRLVLDGRTGEFVGAGAEARLDLLARDIELLGDDVEIEGQRALRRRNLGKRRGGRQQKCGERGETAPPQAGTGWHEDTSDKTG